MPGLWYYYIVRKREKGKTMTKMMNNLTKYEKHVWENGSAWQRANVAYDYDAMDALTTDELKEVVNTLEAKNFIAEMSDDYATTRREKARNCAVANAAKAILNK